jgi:hypothetical protein
LATVGFSVVMFLNRKPGTPMLMNPTLNPSILNDRGRSARKWSNVLAISGATWLIFGSVVGWMFFRR